MAECPHFGSCGGCSTQHIPYDAQVANKQKIVSDALARSKIEWDGTIKAFSGNPFNYRNRMDFIFGPNGLSFRQKQRWDRVVPITTCPIANEKVNLLREEVQKWYTSQNLDCFDNKKKSGTMKYAVIRAPTNASSISFVLNSDSTQLAKHIDAIKEFAKTSTADSIVITYSPKDKDVSISEDFFVVKGEDTLIETIQGKEITFSVQGFMQNNTGMADSMVGYVKQLFQQYTTTNGFMLDLYGGVGLFGISCAPMFKDVLVVESFKGSIDTAKYNAEMHKYSHVDAICKDAAQLQKLNIIGKSAGKDLFVLTDPPRAGMHHKTVRYLCELKAPVVIYVSCNPNQLSRELVAFRDLYKIKSAAMFDLFPQTNHCEAVVELILK